MLSRTAEAPCRGASAVTSASSWARPGSSVTVPPGIAVRRSYFPAECTRLLRGLKQPAERSGEGRAAGFAADPGHVAVRAGEHRRPGGQREAGPGAAGIGQVASGLVGVQAHAGRGAGFGRGLQPGLTSRACEQDEAAGEQIVAADNETSFPWNVSF
jgi:hypothetical protein